MEGRVGLAGQTMPSPDKKSKHAYCHCIKMLTKLCFIVTFETEVKKKLKNVKEQGILYVVLFLLFFSPGPTVLGFVFF